MLSAIACKRPSNAMSWVRSTAMATIATGRPSGPTTIELRRWTGTVVPSGRVAVKSPSHPSPVVRCATNEAACSLTSGATTRSEIGRPIAAAAGVP